MSAPIAVPALAELEFARALHSRRALEQALDHGTALLAALSLPGLVDDGFVAIDPQALGDALEVGVAHLDTIDPDPDLEPENELLEPDGDDELDLGWSALHSQVLLGNNTADGDLTAPERHGRGFVRCGADDHEDGHDAEDERDGGTDDGEDASHYTGRLVFRPRARRAGEAAHG